MPHPKPTVSIILATMNDEAFITETLESLVDQDYERMDIHLQVHARSNDRTREIARRFPVKVVVEDDLGVPDALNRGRHNTTGEILIHLGADDPLLPGAVRTLVEALETDPDAGFAYGDIEYIDAASNPYLTLRGGRFDLDRMFWGNFVPTQAVAVRRSALEAVGGYRNGIINADWDLWIRLGARYSSVYVPQTLGRYRVHNGSLTLNNLSKMAASMRFVADSLTTDGVVASKLSRGVARARAGPHYIASALSIFAGDRHQGWTDLMTAFRLYPRGIMTRAGLSAVLANIAGPALYARVRNRGRKAS